MSEHVIWINEPAKNTPARILPDGAFTGNGDLAAVLAGTADRIRIHVCKTDFWKSDGRVGPEGVCGGTAPVGVIQILLPQLAYASYRVEQNLDLAYIKLHLEDRCFSADMKLTVCAGENTMIIELERTFPAVSASVRLIPCEGFESVSRTGETNGISFMERGFDTPECRYPTYCMCALKTVSRSVLNGRERIVWAVNVRTNHETAAYDSQSVERVADIDSKECTRLLAEHEKWWARFWSKSGIEIEDREIQLAWYAGLYAVACCSRNKKFPPGLWGGYSTSDGMAWFGDYHLNYNYEAPFYALTSSNHTELLECYSPVINDFLPTAKRFAKDYFGIDGAIFPVGLGPLGLETDYRPETREHGHLFHGQKSNGAYLAVIPMMHWYATRDKEFAKREYYGFLLAVAEFWENYLVMENGEYQIYNDALNEVSWYMGNEHMPQGHDDKNPIVSCGLVRMLMNLVTDISEELGENTDKIPVWKNIVKHLPKAKTVDSNGEKILRAVEGSCDVRELSLEYMYPVGEIGKYSDPELFEAARNTHRRLSIWDSHNRFCSYYPMAARLELPPDEILGHIHDVLKDRGLPNGMVRYDGGGLENSSAVTNTVNEMLLQSYEGIIRLFPVWDRNTCAKFHGLRAKGAFIIDASLENGKITAEILSEKGFTFTVEKPGDGYILITGDGSRIPLTERFTSVGTVPGEVIRIFSE